MSPHQTKTHILTTPCIGRCSTTFGDEVCRGCRRYSHEIINWNEMSNEDKFEIWERLNYQLDKIILSFLPKADFEKVRNFLEEKHIAQPEKNSIGRVYYLALKFCYKFPSYTEESGLNLRCTTAKEICLIIEDQAYSHIKYCEN
jgi:predicted Fe-S protein YdhL (DUF1289 family)